MKKTINIFSILFILIFFQSLNLFAEPPVTNMITDSNEYKGRTIEIVHNKEDYDIDKTIHYFNMMNYLLKTEEVFKTNVTARDGITNRITYYKKNLRGETEEVTIELNYLEDFVNKYGPYYHKKLVILDETGEKRKEVHFYTDTYEYRTGYRKTVSVFGLNGKLLKVIYYNEVGRSVKVENVN